MKVSNKAHRVMTIVAAILMLLTLLFSSASTVITMISNAARGMNSGVYIGTTLFTLVITIAVTVLTIIPLFRGKKDTLAAVLFLLTALITAGRNVISRVFTIISVLSTGVELYGDMYSGMLTANVILLIAGVVTVVVRVLLTLECFKPGVISGSMMKLLLILLPIVYAVLNAVSMMAQQAGMLGRQDLAMYIVGVIVPAVISLIAYIPEILMGIAFAIPVYEKTAPACVEEPQTTF